MGMAKVNVVSTVVGVPLAWGIMFLAEVVAFLLLGGSAVYLEWSGLDAYISRDFDSPLIEFVFFLIGIAWPFVPLESGIVQALIPIAAALLLIPCFYASVWIECHYCLQWWARYDPVLVRRAVYRTNLGSYALLFVLACVWIAVSKYP